MCEGCAVWDQEFSKWPIKFYHWIGLETAKRDHSYRDFMVSKFSRSRSNGDAGWLTRRWRCRGHAPRTLKSQNAHRLRSLNAFRSKVSDLNRRFVNTIHSKVFSTASSSTSTISQLRLITRINSPRYCYVRETPINGSSFMSRAIAREFSLPAQLFRRQSWLPSARAPYVCNWLSPKFFSSYLRAYRRPLASSAAPAPASSVVASCTRPTPWWQSSCQSWRSYRSQLRYPSLLIVWAPQFITKKLYASVFSKLDSIFIALRVHTFISPTSLDLFPLFHPSSDR